MHIGLNAVDPRKYEGWDGTLVACEADAKDMHAITSARGFTASMLMTRKATAAAVTAAIRRAAGKLDAGDLFVLSYSGHGGQVRDPSGEEADWEDETWVLWDRQLLDDELYALWSRFKPGVRILVLSDSCHSGSVVRDMFYGASPANAATSDRFKFIPRDVQDRTYEAHRDEYDALQQTFAKGDAAAVGASVVLISGCQDSQYSRDGDRNRVGDSASCPLGRRGRDQRLRPPRGAAQVLGAAEALRVQLVDVLGSGRPGGEPALFGRRP